MIITITNFLFVFVCNCKKFLAYQFLYVSRFLLFPLLSCPNHNLEHSVDVLSYPTNYVQNLLDYKLVALRILIAPHRRNLPQNRVTTTAVASARHGHTHIRHTSGAKERDTWERARRTMRRVRVASRHKPQRATLPPRLYLFTRHVITANVTFNNSEQGSISNVSLFWREIFHDIRVRSTRHKWWYFM